MLRTAFGWVVLTTIFIAALPLYVPLAIFGQGRRLANKLRTSRTERRARAYMASAT
jgi:hypothetical protein